MPGPPERPVDAAGPPGGDRRRTPPTADGRRAGADARGAAAEVRPDTPATAGAWGTDEVFQYALLRVVPSVARGEGLNVGVVLHARRHRFLGLRTAVDHARLRALDPALDIGVLEEHLGGLRRVADGDSEAGAIAAMPRSDRFGWLAAPSNTIVQPSPVHTGLCGDPSATLDRLVRQLVVVG